VKFFRTKKYEEKCMTHDSSQPSHKVPKIVSIGYQKKGQH